jgi:hypothetical protein
VADDLQPCRDFLQHLGRRLAELDQAGGVAAAATARDLGLMHQNFTWQMRRRRLSASRILSRFGVTRRALRTGCNLLTQIFLEIFEPQLQLCDLAVQHLRGAAVALPAQRGQLHFHVFDLEQSRLQLALISGKFSQLHESGRDGPGTGYRGGSR